MPRDASGDFTLPTNDSSPAAPRNVIRSSDFNELMTDVSEGLTDSLSRSGDGAMQANLDMGGFDLTNTASVYMKGGNNLSDLSNAATARDNLGVEIGVDVQAYNANLTTLGTSQADALNYLDAPIYIATRTAMKALDTTKITTAILTEGVPARSGRFGTFIWQSGDFSTQITADPNEGVYIKADAIASASGAWVREGWGDLDPHWFGCTGDGTTDDTSAFQAVVDFIEDTQPERKVIALGNARYLVSTITIPTACLQLQMYGNGPFASQIRSSTVTAGRVFLVYAQGCQFRDFRLQNDTFDVSAVARHGFELTKDYGVSVPEADVDAEFHNVEISRFQRGIYLKGRGLKVESSLFSVCLYPVYLDWPSVGDYTPGADPAQEDAGGFRGIHIDSCRFHSNTDAGVANIDTNASKINGLQITNCQVDIGRPLFYGHLGIGGSLIDGGTITETPLEGLEITGGSDYLVTNLTIAGSEGLSVDRIPANFIKLTGTHDNGTFRNLVLKRCTDHGIDCRSGTFTNMVFEALTFIDPCRSVGNFCPFVFVGSGHDAIVRNITVDTANSLTGVVRTDNAGTAITVANIDFRGNTLPYFIGTGSNAYTPLVFAQEYRIGSAGTARILTGTGTPEGAVTAIVGSLFLRLDGGATTTLYVKTSGTGNTGWTAK